MKRYTHLTSEQRYLISNGLKEGYSQQAIAAIVGGVFDTETRAKRSMLVELSPSPPGELILVELVMLP